MRDHAGREGPSGSARRPGRLTLVACATAALLTACAGGGSPASGGAASTSGPGASTTTAPPMSAASSPPAPASSSARASSSTLAAPSPPPTTSCVDRTLAGLSRTERAGQLLLIGVDATDPAAAAGSLARLGVAGIFLQGRVAGGSALRSGIASVQTAARRAGAPHLLVAADEEGGLVQTVRGGTIAPFPAALTQGGWTPSTLARTTRTWGRGLAALGVNLDLAPVADVVPASLGAANPPIGRYGREYAHTVPGVSAPVGTVTAALRAVGVGATVKHFPGLGRVLANTDTSSAAVDATTTVTDPALQPFSEGMRAGALAVMVSSARYPRLDGRHPAMWSPSIVTGLLRQRLGWHGLVVSDDLGAAVAAAGLPVGQRATAFVGAGGDLVLTVVTSQAVTMRDALVARATADRAFAARVDDAARHVLAAKAALGLLSCG
jgi:beta-N-acetylhexosaminidase